MIKIHQIWFQGVDKIPEKYLKYQQSIKKINSNYILVLWDSKSINNLLKQYFPTYYNWYQKIPLMIQKIDIAKCFILWKHGGIYIDLDIELIKDISELYNSAPNKIIVGQIALDPVEKFFCKRIFGIDKIINNGIIFSPPNSSFWKNYINNICLKKYGLSKINKSIWIMNSTGPISLTKAMNKNLNKFKILKSKYLEAGILTNQSQSSDQYIIHHHTLSWSNFIKNFCYIWKWIKSNIYWLIILSGVLILIVLNLHFNL